MTNKELQTVLATYPDDMQVGIRNTESRGHPTYDYTTSDLDIREAVTEVKKVAWWQRSTEILVLVGDHYGTAPKK